MLSREPQSRTFYFCAQEAEAGTWMLEIVLQGTLMLEMGG
jgi:hypothetical protein